jgi:hypothetical protein
MIKRKNEIKTNQMAMRVIKAEIPFDILNFLYLIMESHLTIGLPINERTTEMIT